jgi:hypothetical protein
MTALARTLVFVGVLAVHWIAQFFAWSYAERSAPMRVLWNILATPLIHVAGPLTNEYFWIVASLNSTLWAGTLTYVLARYALKP